jgi:DNA-binding SARP family transcriptional activator/WD40 repeat protein
MDSTVKDELSARPLIILSGRVSLDGKFDEALGGDRQRRLLAGLTLRRGKVVPPDWLNDIVWYGEEPPDSAPGAIRTYVYRLRKSLADTPGDVRIKTVGSSYRLDCDPGSIDLDVFETSASAAERQLESGAPDDAYRSCTDALTIWRGRPYGEFADESWAIAEATRLDELHLLVEEWQASSLLGMGRLDNAISQLDGLTAAEPLRERRCELLMRAQVRAGRHGDALRSFSDYRTRLLEGSGLDPSPALVELERRILDEDESLRRPPTLRTIRSFDLLEQLPTDGVMSSWRARHPSLEHEVRLDGFPAAIANDPRFVRNFDPWMRRISRLEHPSIVGVDDHWREPGSAHAVSRLLRGNTLEAIVNAGDLDGLRFDDIVDQVGEALLAAHTDGVVHGAVSARTIASDHLGHWYLTGFANPAAILGEAELVDDVRSLAAVLASLAGRLIPDDPDVVPDSTIDDLDVLLTEIRKRSTPALRAPRKTAGGGLIRNPYPGLRPFDDSERPLFFGREQLIHDVVDRLTNDVRLSIIIGPSGTGKSSLLHAGVLPVLVEADGKTSLVARLTPGNEPFERLATAVRSVGSKSSAHELGARSIITGGLDAAARLAIPGDESLIVAVDQLEELFLLCEPETQGRFLDVILAAATEPDGPVRVIVTLRSDHFGGLLTSPAFAANLQRSLIAVPPFTSAELERVITGPAHMAGVDVEARLVSALTGELAERPNLLPHLQHFLRLLFDQRPGSVLSYRAYEDIGGVTASLGRTGEQVFERLDDDQKQTLRRVLRRLSHVAADGTTSRRVAPVEDIIGIHPSAETVLESLAAERLVVFDNDRTTRAPTVEITHEALFRGWPRLQKWQREDVELTRLIEELNDRSRTWLELEHDSGELLRGGRLEQVRQALPTVEDELSERERLFVDESIRADDETRERERVRNRRLRTTLVIAIIGLVISATAGIIALGQRSDAKNATAAAQESANVAETRRMSADAVKLVDSDRRAALLLALEAYRRAPGPESLGGIQQVLVGLGPFLGSAGADREYLSVEWLDASTVVGVHDVGTDVLNVDTGERVLEIRTPSSGALAVSSLGDYAVGTTQPTVDVYGRSGVLRHSLAHASIVRTLTFSPDGQQLATGDRAGRIRIWDVASGALTAGPVDAHLAEDLGNLPEELQIPADAAHEPQTFPIGVEGLAYDPTGSRLSSSGGFTVRIFDPSDLGHLQDINITRPTVTRTDRGPGRPRDLVWTETDEIQVAVESYRQRWRISSGELVVEESVSEQQGSLALDSFRMTSAAGRVVLGLPVGKIQVEGPSAEETLAIELHDGVRSAGFDLALSPDGQTIALAGQGVQFFAIDGRQLIAEVGPQTGLFELLVSADGETLITFDREQIAGGTWSYDSSQISWTGSIDERLFPDRFGPLTSEANGRLTGRDLDSLAATSFNATAFNQWAGQPSPTDPIVAIGMGQPGPTRLVIVDSESGEELRRLEDFSELAPDDSYVGSVSFSADGRHLAAASENGAALVWDTETWDRVATLSEGAGQVVLVSFSPDGQWLLTARDDGPVVVRDAATFQPTGRELIGAGRAFASGNAFGYSDDGMYVTTSVDSQPRIFDLETGALIGSEFPGDFGTSVNVSGDGSVATTIAGSVGRVWDLNPDEWVRKGCIAVGRNFTEAEWATFGPTGEEPARTCEQWPEPGQE